MICGVRGALMVACVLLAKAALAGGVADDLAERFARTCMADPSPVKSANDAAKAAKWEVNAGLSGVDMPTPSHIVTTQTWRAGTIAGTDVAVVATDVANAKCRVQACGVVADRLRDGGIEAALVKRLKLPADATVRDVSSTGTQITWPLKVPADHIVAFAAQKSLAGDRVTLSVTQVCPRS